MPRPVDSHTRYLPGLDGLRALAVALVILYHLGVPGFRGGLLGVGVFFTISGFLITGLLVAGWRRRGWALGTFWLRRARRLLPAVVVLLVTCLAVVAITDRSDLYRRGTDALSALFYVANWHTIAVGNSYFDQVHGPGPFDHLWSLSIEEQYYLVWPLLLVAMIAVFRGRMMLVAGMTALLAAGSFVALSLLAHPGVDNTRAYEGTGTRAGGLLVGACLALLWLAVDRGEDPPLRRWWLNATTCDLLGVAGLVGVGWLVQGTSQNTFATYQWGLAALSVATAALLVAVAYPGTALGRAFGVLPLRWLGERSYGIYLWHLPVIVFTPREVLQAQPAVRDLVQVLLAVVLAALSWTFIEQPIRTLGFRRAFQAVRGATVRPWARVYAGGRPPRVAVAVVAFLPLAVLAMLLPHALPREQPAALAAAPPPPTVPGHPRPTVTPTTSTLPQPLRTACTSVIEVGDSTSEGLVGKDSSLPPSQNLQGQLADVGVTSFTADISGARSIIESYQHEPSGLDVVEQHVDAGYRGCWIIALGNIDAATVLKYAPNTTSIADRIKKIMTTIPPGSPVLWMTTRTLLTSGTFREAAYPPWNEGLVQACGTYPNMRVFDWAAAYQTGWFGPDGIHSTTVGYQHKAQLMARALAVGFPATGAPPSSCLIETPGP